LTVAGLTNARDLGGLPAADGRTIPRGRVFRAEVLTGPDDDSIYPRWNDDNAAAIADLGIRTVVDLRGETEALVTVSHWAEATGGSRHGFPIHDGGHGAARDYVDMLLTGRMSAFRGVDMGEHYIAILEDRATVFAGALDVIADGTPALIHCTEGKDRTGLLVALLLGAVGTSAEHIVEDYALTGIWRPDRARAYASLFEAAGVDYENFRTLYESPAVAMRMTLEHLESAYGGVLGYLTHRAGASSDLVPRLRRALLRDDVPGSGEDEHIPTESPRPRGQAWLQ
jgi:protein-tyrosine phosphatase